MNQALFRQCQDACHFPIYTENVKMSVPPAASAGNITQSKTAQIPLLLAAKRMEMQQSFPCPILVYDVFVQSFTVLQFACACLCVHLNVISCST